MKLQLIWNRPSNKEKSLKLSVNISHFSHTNCRQIWRHQKLPVYVELGIYRRRKTSIECRATGDRPACCACAQAGASSLLPTLTSTVNKVPSLAFSKLKIRSTSKSVHRKGKAGKFLQSSSGLNFFFIFKKKKKKKKKKFFFI